MSCNNLISVITPVHKYDYIHNLLDNFNKQKYQDKELILIFNGELSNYCMNNSYTNIVSLYYKDELNISKIRNVGLEWMKENNRKIFSFMDSDDEYSSDYLSEAMNILKQGYELVGKSNFRFTNNNSDIYHTNGILNERVNGPTITGYLSEKRFNPLLNTIAEDLDFVSQHSNIGFSSINNFLYNVRNNSIQNRSFEQFIELMKMYNTTINNKSFEIYKNNTLFWKYGDGFNSDIIFPKTTDEEINMIYKYHEELIKTFDSDQ